jgi:hypothetical protein
MLQHVNIDELVSKLVLFEGSDLHLKVGSAANGPGKWAASTPGGLQGFATRGY